MTKQTNKHTSFKHHETTENRIMRQHQITRQQITKCFETKQIENRIGKKIPLHTEREMETKKEKERGRDGLKNRDKPKTQNI